MKDRTKQIQIQINVMCQKCEHNDNEDILIKIHLLFIVAQMIPADAASHKV